MAGTGIEGAGLSGTMRMTWLSDHLAHVLEHCETDEPSGTWTGLACPDHGLALGGDVDNAILRRLAAQGEIADLIWEPPGELKLLQNAGLTRFSPVKPQRWVVASFEHHCGPHGLPQPHTHNLVITARPSTLTRLAAWYAARLPGAVPIDSLPVDPA